MRRLFVLLWHFFPRRNAEYGAILAATTRFQSRSSCIRRLSPPVQPLTCECREVPRLVWGGLPVPRPINGEHPDAVIPQRCLIEECRLQAAAGRPLQSTDFITWHALGAYASLHKCARHGQPLRLACAGTAACMWPMRRPAYHTRCCAHPPASRTALSALWAPARLGPVAARQWTPPRKPPARRARRFFHQGYVTRVPIPDTVASRSSTGTLRLSRMTCTDRGTCTATKVANQLDAGALRSSSHLAAARDFGGIAAAADKLAPAAC